MFATCLGNDFGQTRVTNRAWHKKWCLCCGVCDKHVGGLTKNGCYTAAKGTHSLVDLAVMGAKVTNAKGVIKKEVCKDAESAATSRSMDQAGAAHSNENTKVAAPRERLASALQSFLSSNPKYIPAEVLEALGDSIPTKDGILPPRIFFEAVEQTSIAMSITDLNANILYVNGATLRLTGYEIEELVGNNQSMLSDKKTPKHVYQKLWKTITSGNIWNGSLLNRRKDGSTYLAELSIVPIHTGPDEIGYFLGMHRDVTDVHRLQKQVSHHKDLIESVVNSAPTIMALVDLDGNVILDNLAYKSLATEMDGHEPAEFFLAGLTDVIGPNLKASSRSNKTCSNVELSYEPGQGREPKWFSCSARWVRDVDSTAESYFESGKRKETLLLVCNDITAERRMRERAQLNTVRALMAEQQMTQGIREILSGAAFQLQGPLNVISAMSDMMKRQKRSDPNVVAAIAQVLESGRQALETLKASTPETTIEPESRVNINELVREVLELSVDKMLSADLVVDWNPTFKPAIVYGQKNALRGLIMLLIDNAIEAVGEPDAVGRELFVSTNAMTDDTITLKIRDSGPGFPKHLRARAFEPFYSSWTNTRGKAGMGLTIAQQIISDHGASLQIDDAESGGCTITVFLPVYKDQ